MVLTDCNLPSREGGRCTLGKADLQGEPLSACCKGIIKIGVLTEPQLTTLAGSCVGAVALGSALTSDLVGNSEVGSPWLI